MERLTEAYRRGLDAGRRRLAYTLNPYAERTLARDDWERGWICATGEYLRGRHAQPGRTAAILPHPSLTAAQCELVCAREGLALARIGRDRFILVRTADRPRPMLRVAHSNPEAA